MKSLVSLLVLVALFHFRFGAATVLQPLEDVDPDEYAQGNSSIGHEYQPQADVQGNISMGHEYQPQDGTSRIINGDYVRSPGDTPWIAAILRENFGNTFVCTGSLIHSEWVLTAAHCVAFHYQPYCYQYFIKYQAKDFKVVIGDINLGDGYIPYGVKDVRYHPKFDNGCRGHDYDFGLLRLERKQPSWRIICLSEIYGNGYLYGYGATQSGGSASALLKYYRYRSGQYSECKKGYAPDSYRYTNNAGIKICHQGITQRDGTCHGDSGGPLVLRRSTSSKARLIGVHSFGDETCQEHIPMVAGRVKYVKSWIVGVIRTYRKC